MECIKSGLLRSVRSIEVDSDRKIVTTEPYLNIPFLKQIVTYEEYFIKIIIIINFRTGEINYH